MRVIEPVALAATLHAGVSGEVFMSFYECPATSKHKAYRNAAQITQIDDVGSLSVSPPPDNADQSAGHIDYPHVCGFGGIVESPSIEASAGRCVPSQD